MIIAVASDHGGFALKNIIKEHLTERGYKVVDLGTDSQESVDYPVYGRHARRKWPAAERTWEWSSAGRA